MVKESITKNNINIIDNSFVVDEPNISVLATQLAEPTENEANASVYKAIGNQPALLKSLALSYDSIFVTNFAIKVVLNGLNISNNKFKLPPGGSASFDYVPTGSNYKIPPGSILQIYAYNTNSANTTNGVFNVLAIFDILENG